VPVGREHDWRRNRARRSEVDHRKRIGHLTSGLERRLRSEGQALRIRSALLLTALVVGVVESHAQVPTATVWVPQAPPLGAIATLSQLPDLRSALAVAGPAVTDIRVAEWSPLSRTPGRFLRLLQVDNAVKPTLTLWWFGGLGPAEPPLTADRRCTIPAESPRVCVQPVLAPEQQDWAVLMRTLLSAEPCPPMRPTDGFELRLQVYESSRVSPRYRELAICDPVAAELRRRLDTMTVHVFAR